MTSVLRSNGPTSLQVWKLADFGTCSEATSKRFNTTRFSRGTPCYRAPEILDEAPVFNNKTDVWALGCIVYELFAKAKAFSSDWAVHTYSAVNSELAIEKLEKLWPPQPLCPTRLDLSTSSFNFGAIATIDAISKRIDTILDEIRQHIFAMLSRDPNERSPARDLLLVWTRMKKDVQALSEDLPSSQSLAIPYVGGAPTYLGRPLEFSTEARESISPRDKINRDRTKQRLVAIGVPDYHSWGQVFSWLNNAYAGGHVGSKVFDVVMNEYCNDAPHLRL